MNHNFCSVIFLLLLFKVQGENNYPVVLVHGLGGMALNWMYRREIEDQGLRTIAFNVGKITSNWDRACEIYAQLKGTRVDFGVCHSRQYGHSRYGKDFTGQALFAEWDENHKVHLWGHSMGGPTIRTLERMLRIGSDCPEDDSPLFKGGRNWIASVTTMSGVLDGTSLIDILDRRQQLNMLKTMVMVSAGIIDNTFVDVVYEIDLEHWGLEREEGESFEEYWERVEDSYFFSEENEDICLYDLSIEGTRKFNNLGVLEYPDTYYFAFASERTKDSVCVGLFCEAPHQIAEVQMLPFLWYTANKMGKLSETNFQKNDGLVNFMRQFCPNKNDSDIWRCPHFEKTWNPGHWFVYEIDYLDHVQIVMRDPVNDLFNPRRSAQLLYQEHGKRVKALPST